MILVAICAVVAMTLFPPFVATNGAGDRSGYHFLLDPPSTAYRVNVSLLIVQVAIASLITVAICFLKSKED